MGCEGLGGGDAGGGEERQRNESRIQEREERGGCAVECAEVREKHGDGEEMVEIAAPGDADGVQLSVHRRRELQRGRDGRFRWLESDFAHRCEGGEAAPWEGEVNEALPEA